MEQNDRGTDAPIASVRAHGRKVDFLITDPEDHIQGRISRSNAFYESDLLDALFHRAMPGMRFVDVGANIGNHSLYLAGIAGMTGHAFEPFKSNFDLMRINLELNDLETAVTARNIALGRSAGRGRSVGDAGRHNTGTYRVELRKDGDIEVATLDGLDLAPFHLLKIDVEGAEIDVLMGASRSIRRFRPLIAIEAQTPAQFEEIRHFLSGFSYRPTRRYCVTPTYLFEAD